MRAAVVVVDSASTDATAAVVRDFPRGPVPVSLLRCERPGKGIAVRAGLLATRAPFVGFCDADLATDTQCGFRFFSGPLARAAALPLRTAGFAFDVELIARCQRLGATLTEIPVHWRDVTGSTFSVSRHSAAVFRNVAAIWLRSRTSREPAPLLQPARLHIPTPPPLPAQPIGAMGTTPA